MKYEGGFDFETGESTVLTTKDVEPPEPSFRQHAEKFIRCREHSPDTPILKLFTDAIYQHWNPGGRPDTPDWVRDWLLEQAEWASDCARKRGVMGERTLIVHYPTAVTMFLDRCRALAGRTAKP